jgi:predicted CXXCH cytochrome family protein
MLDESATLSDVQEAWATSIGGDVTFGITASMCASCHDSSGAYSSMMYDAMSDGNVYHPLSHGMKMSFSSPPPATDPLSSQLPYINSAKSIIECSTCHDPHNDFFRPFLLTSIETLCSRCHGQRQFVGGTEVVGALDVVGNWDLSSFTGLSNPGSHPVGPDVFPDNASLPVIEIGEVFRVPFNQTPSTWSLGPHLSNGDNGGVICVTCHAVHGSDPDPEAGNTVAESIPPNQSFLAVAQSIQSLNGYSRPIPNGQGSYNKLCESCHGVGNNPTAALEEQHWADNEHNVNPGFPATFSHPVDSYPSSRGGLAISPPDNWPAGEPGLKGQNVSYTLICETCHVAHPAAGSSANRPDVTEEAGAYLLRAPIKSSVNQAAICDLCHQSEIEGHHPISKNFDGSGVDYLINVALGPENVLTCATCHTTAHNWTQPGRVGLDPSWNPTDNGRYKEQVADMFNPDMSKTCMDWHYFMDGDGFSVSPTKGTLQEVILPSDEEFKHYQTVDRSMGTHYIGVIHEDDADKWRGEPLIGVVDTSRTWLRQSPDSLFDDGLADGWSRFGGANLDGSRVLGCESCHELEPDKNNGFAHLLLAPYKEGNNGINEYPGDDDGADILCLVCHGKPSGAHPMTGDIVSRSGAILDPNVGWVRDTVLGNATLDFDYSSMSCDSCHQPHDANSAGLTYILDVPEDMPIPGYSGKTIGEGEIITDYGALTSYGYAEALGYQGGYVTPKSDSVDHHILCLQCHAK